MALVKPCPRCKRLIPHGWPYCLDCKPIAEAQRQEARERKAEYLKKKYNRRYNSRRDPKYSAFYNSREWKATSRAKLQAAKYKCTAGLAGCAGIACEVHHIQPIQTAEGWERRLDWENLEPLCTACHNGRHPEKLRRRQDPEVLDLREIQREIDKNGDIV
jgi:5-methylcytosine-specific restriction endonuclease McrA